MMKKEGS